MWYYLYVEQFATNLSRFVDSLQERGQYTFSRKDALLAMEMSPIAFKRAAERLKAKRRLAAPRRGFYTIVPLEYRQSGAPPATSFIDQLMRFHDTSYYVGLLSAAELHGAAHQKPQEFQVIAAEQLRPLRVGRNRIRFFLKKDLERTPVDLFKTSSGRMRISTAEATAIDLVRYVDRVGHLNYVATVLAELAEKLDARKLVEAAVAEGELSAVQRLGYLLEVVGAGKVASKLAKWLAGRSPRPVLLNLDRPGGEIARNLRWRVIVNCKVEPDDL